MHPFMWKIERFPRRFACDYALGNVRLLMYFYQETYRNRKHMHYAVDYKIRNRKSFFFVACVCVCVCMRNLNFYLYF